MTRTLTARLRSRARTLPQRACAVAVAAVSAVGAPVVLTAGGGEAPAPVAASAKRAYRSPCSAMPCAMTTTARVDVSSATQRRPRSVVPSGAVRSKGWGCTGSPRGGWLNYRHPARSEP